MSGDKPEHVASPNDNTVPATTYPVLTSEHYLVSTNGQIKFTDAGLEWFRPYLAYAGIDIRTIKTWDAFVEARSRAAPYFMKRLADHVKSLPTGGEYDLLRSIMLDDEATCNKKFMDFDRRKTFKLVK